PTLPPRPPRSPLFPYTTLFRSTGWTRAIVVIAGANGLGLFAVVIAYLPVLYQAFNRREVGVLLLDARAGSPPSGPELLHRMGSADRKSTRLNSSHVAISYAVFC